MAADPNVALWEFIKSQFIFIVAAVGTAVTFIKYITKKHDEKYDGEIKRLDTKIDNLKEILTTNIGYLKDWFKSHDKL